MKRYYFEVFIVYILFNCRVRFVYSDAITKILELGSVFEEDASKFEYFQLA